MSEKKRNRKGLSSEKGTRDILCPFFRTHSSTEIHCEGFMEGTTQAMIFRRQERKEFFQRIYCKEQYQKCEYYRMLMREVYADED